MKFVTFQPNSVIEGLNEKGEYELKEYHVLSNGCGTTAVNIEERVGYKPIFAFPLSDKRDFLTRCIMEFPSAPQSMIIFKSNQYDTVGYLKWLQTIAYTLAEENYMEYPFDLRPDDLKINDKGVFNEFVVPKIELKNVKKIIKITDNENTFDAFGSTCNDEFMDFIYSEAMSKVLKKYFPKDNSFFTPTHEVDAIKREEIIRMITNLVKNTPQLTDKYLFEVYNKIKLYYLR